MKFWITFLILVGFTAISAKRDLHEKLAGDKKNRFYADQYPPPVEEKNPEFWNKKSQDRIAELIRSIPQKRQAKNIILFIGDGMSISTTTAARIFKGQQRGSLTGEEESLSFEKFPFTGLSKTYCTNGQVPESSCTSTALHSGIKSNVLTLGLNAEVLFNDCFGQSNPQNHVSSIASWAQKAGKATGFVTTTRVTHATPAGLYAHCSNRFWESDLDVQEWSQNSNTCQDIARQLIRNEPGNKFNVILGGGREKFLPNTVQDESGNLGERTDGANLIEEWRRNHTQGQYVTNPFQLKNIPATTTDLFGLFHTSNMDYYSSSRPNEQPTLAEMTQSAIEILQKNNRGFFLMVEGGLIDSAHHFTQSRRALEETVEFDKAVEMALGMTNIRDTLIVVTSDHSHAMSFTGNPRRGNDILGVNDIDLADDYQPFTSLSYANGPEQYLDATGKRVDISESIDPLFRYPSYVPMITSSHGGDDVAVYAIGPYSHYLSGNYEQNDIAHIMAFAGCLGTGRTHCRKGGK